MNKDYLSKATNPLQYDSDILDWEKEGLKDSPTRLFFQEYLEKYLDVRGKTVLDIGSGMGQLFPLLKQLGASEIQGIEPSHHNAEISKKLYPDVPIYQGTLANAPVSRLFDAVTTVMVFEHIEDISSAFKKIGTMLASHGVLYLIVGDKQYHITPRYGYKLKVVDIGNDAVVMETTRPLGVMYDILRPLNHYLETAQKNLFSLENHVELKPTEAFMNSEPKYRAFAGNPICHLLIFKKNT